MKLLQAEHPHIPNFNKLPLRGLYPFPEDGVYVQFKSDAA